MANKISDKFNMFNHRQVTFEVAHKDVQSFFEKLASHNLVDFNTFKSALARATERTKDVYYVQLTEYTFRSPSVYTFYNKRIALA